MKDSQARWMSFGVAAILLAVAYPIAGQKGKKVDLNLIYQATPIPDRIILTWAGDPATTAAVTWRTDASVTAAVAEIAVAEDGPHFVKKARQVHAHTEKLEAKPDPAHYHS